MRTPTSNTGFTLIELSIVLVIIGLLIGGVLMGKDLIAVSAIRSQISQIEKFNTAVNIFKGKYEYLPGDIPNGDKFGFPASAGAGYGDGNGLVYGAGGIDQIAESLVFWTDLSLAGLIPYKLTIGDYTTDVRFNPPNQFYPTAQLNKTGYLFAWNYNNANYYTIHGCNNTGGCGNAGRAAYPVITPAQAFSIDAKMDDGYPTTGKVTAMYGFNPTASWSGITCSTNGCTWIGVYNLTTALAPDSTTCFDNGGVASATQRYSTTQNGGENATCAMSFQF